MENGAISDAQISASSQWDASHATKQGRLHFQAVPGKSGSWCAGANNVNQWLQIDLGNQRTKVTRLATQGRNGYSQWVTKYKLQYSDDGVTFLHYKQHGAVKVSYAFLFETMINGQVVLIGEVLQSILKTQSVEITAIFPVL